MSVILPSQVSCQLSASATATNGGEIQINSLQCCQLLAKLVGQIKQKLRPLAKKSSAPYKVCP
jgi:hypothetical protein